VCLGPSTGPEALIFKRLREKWPGLQHHQPNLQPTPSLSVCGNLKEFIAEQLERGHPHDDYREFLQLAAHMIGLHCSAAIRKSGARHRARWMAKAIYTIKIELLFDGNKSVIKLTAHKLEGIQRFNRFVVNIYIQSWFSSRNVSDAPEKDISLI